jgi:hypothetical protein
VLLGDGLCLVFRTVVLGFACSTFCAPVELARAFGCTVEGVELAPEFHAAAEERAAAEGLADLLSFRLGDASAERLAPGAYDAALCLGATFAFGGLGPTLEALRPCVRPDGNVVVGEPYWRTWPLPADFADRDAPYALLEETVATIEAHDLRVVGVIAASQDDWDRYETLRWRSVEEWLTENGDDPDAAGVRSMHQRGKGAYLRHGRDVLGWAIFVCRVPSQS